MRRPLTLSLAFLLGAVCLGTATPRAADAPAGAGGDEVSAAVALFDQGRADAAGEAFARILRQRPDDPVSLYYSGRLTNEAGAARRFFTRVARDHPEHDLADDALFELGETDYAGPMGLYVSARRHYRALVSGYPRSPLAPIALYRIGRTYLAAGEADSAALFFNKVIRDFPAAEVRLHAEVGLAEADERAGRRVLARARVESLAAETTETPGVGSLFARMGLAPDTATATMPVSVVGGRFWVQVGAFESLTNMTALSRRLDRAGYRVREQSRRGQTLHILQVGPYGDAETAERVREGIDLVEGTTSRVVEEGRAK